LAQYPEIFLQKTAPDIANKGEFPYICELKYFPKEIAPIIVNKFKRRFVCAATEIKEN